MVRCRPELAAKGDVAVRGAEQEQTKWGVFFGLVVTLTGVRAIWWSCYRWGRKAATTKWAIFALSAA